MEDEKERATKIVVGKEAGKEDGEMTGNGTVTEMKTKDAENVNVLKDKQMSRRFRLLFQSQRNWQDKGRLRALRQLILKARPRKVMVNHKRIRKRLRAT